MCLAELRLTSACWAQAVASKRRSNVTIERLAAQVQAMVKEWLLRAKDLSSHSPKMLLLFRQLVARAVGRPHVATWWPPPQPRLRGP